MKKYYFAYGSNLNKFQMQFRCTGAKPVGKAYLPDYRLAFKGSKSGAYLTIVKAHGHEVPLGIWEVDSSHEKSLDIYEGYPNFYEKKNMVVSFQGRKIEGFIYVMRPRAIFEMPDDKYVRTCRVGYDDFGFYHAYLDDALEFTAEMIKGEY